MDFHIKPITSMQEIHGAVEVQRQAWQLTDLEIVPTFEMKAVANVGITLIALNKNDKVIGFIYGYHQFPDKHYSHMMAILPEYQGKGIGFALKQAHRKLALESVHRVNYIQWTVDPLLPNNAYLNFAKLGATCSKYYVDYYGNADDFGLYKGLPTDRFLVSWPIRTQRVHERMQDYKAHRIKEATLLARSPPLNAIQHDHWQDLVPLADAPETFTIQVPANFHWLRKHHVRLALEWRLKFRDLAITAFKKGWHVIDYHSFKENDLRRNYYEFSQKLPK